MAVPYAFGFKSCLNTFLLFLFFHPSVNWTLLPMHSARISILWYSLIQRINTHPDVKGLIRSKKVCVCVCTWIEMLFNFQEKIRNFFFSIFILNIFVIENIQSFFHELCTHFSINSSDKLFKFRIDNWIFTFHATIVKDILDSHLLFFSGFNGSWRV